MPNEQPNTEQSIQEIGIPEISMELSVNSVTTQPTDPTLKNDGQPADAKAVGDRFDKTDDDIANLGADVSALSTSVDTRFATVNAKTGTDIPINNGTGAASIEATIAAVNAKTGSNIPVTGETGAASIANAIATVNAKTGASIPINEVSGALSIEGALNAKNGSNIPLTGETGASSIATAISTLNGAAVKSVDNMFPDANGNVTLMNVYPQRKVGVFTIPAGDTTITYTDSWITTDTDCYCHSLEYQNVQTGISWTFANGSITFTLDEALSSTLTFRFGMIKGGVSST